MMEGGVIRIGTRKSDLAVIQTKLVADAIEKASPDVRTELVLRQTMGDKILGKPLLEFGGKGVFVSEFEEGLAKGEIDLAVHSAKDMPMDLAEGLAIVAVPEREDPRDVLVTVAGRELSGKKEIVIGTSSPRRQVQIEAIGPKLWPGAAVRCEMLRGNVNTRLRKLEEGGYDGILLAAAGLKRLDFWTGACLSFSSTFLTARPLSRREARASWRWKAGKEMRGRRWPAGPWRIRRPVSACSRSGRCCGF